MNFINQAVANFKRFSIRDRFFVLLGLALLSRTLSDILMGRLGVATGELYRHRQRLDFPLYGPLVFILEIAILLCASWLFMSRVRVRLAAILMILGTLMSMTQLFQHQKMLFLIVGLGVVFVPGGMNAVSVYFLKAQLLIVYVFSVVSKVATGFLQSSDTFRAIEYSINGDRLRTFFLAPVLQYLQEMPIGYLVVGLEIIVPLAILRAPRAGVLFAVILHMAMAILLSNVLPFSILMIALASLYFPTDKLNEATPS